MAPHKRDASPTSVRSGVRIARRPNKKLRFSANGLLNVERKSGKFLNLCLTNYSQCETEPARIAVVELASELRHRIFEYTLSGHEYFIESIEAKFGSFMTLEAVSKAADKAFALLRVSRQIYAETALLRISLSVFSTSWTGLLHEWLGGLLEAKLNVISKIHLRFDLCPSAPPRSDYYLVSYSEHALMDFTRLPALKRIRVSLLVVSNAPFSNEFCVDVINKKGREVAHQTKMLNPKVIVTADWRHGRLIGEQSWDAMTDIPLEED